MQAITARRILIVEDNALNMRLFNDLLEAHGFTPLCEQNAENVLNVVRNEKPDLILMDIQLPELSGFDLIKLIKADETMAHTPIIAITAFATSGDESKIIEAGFADYISKPISVLGFMETVQKHLAALPAPVQDAPETPTQPAEDTPDVGSPDPFAAL